MPPHTQQSLFELPTSLNIDKSVKEALFRSAKNSGLSREEIVDRMNRLAARFGVSLVTGKPLSLEVLEKWLSPNDLSRFMPVRAIPIFCKAVNDKSVLHEIVSPLGYEIIGEDDKKLLAWARAYQKMQKAKAELKRLESSAL